MKANLKRLEGSLKIATSILPFAVFWGSVGGSIALICCGLSKMENTLDEARETPAFQEMIENDEAILKSQLDNQQITLQEYQERMKYRSSDESVETYIDANTETTQKYISTIKSGNKMASAGVGLTILTTVGSVFGTAFYAACDNGFHKLFDAGQDDIEDANRIKELEKQRKELKKLNKEFDEYKEELV